MAPKNARTSARSGISREQPSSPPKSSHERDTESSEGRRTRSSRSRSVEQQGQMPNTTKSKKSGRAASRESSVESVGSNSRGGRDRHARSIAVPRELSLVTEEREPEEAEEEEVERQHSPGAASEMSGTTAFTSRSQSQLAHIDSNIIDILPDLFRTSNALLDLLIPTEVTAKPIDRIIKNLMAPGSKLANKLKSSEAEFTAARQGFGTEEYIDNGFILRSLFGSEEPGEGPFRPDSVNYLANLATLVKNFLVSQEASSKILTMLETLDKWFPRAFASDFNKHLEVGGTALLEESFSVGLDIKTQLLIRELGDRKDDDGFSPRILLASVFYDLPTSQQDSQKGSQNQTPTLQSVSQEFFEDSPNNKYLKGILGNTASNSDDQAREIQERILSVTESFNAEIAVAAGDPMEFDNLVKEYPWRKFLKNLLQWAQSRHNEISGSIKAQGGVETIVTEVKDIIDELISQDGDLDQESVPNTQEVASSAPILPRSSNENPQSRKHIQNTKTSTAPSRAAFQSTVSVPQGFNTQASPILDDYRPDFDDGEEGPPTQATPARPEFLAALKKSMNEKNKENLAVPQSKKRSIMDPQEDAQAVPWDSQESVGADFEEDLRGHHAKRRKVFPPTGKPGSAQAPGSSNRNHQASNQHAEGSGASQRRQERARSIERARTREAPRADSNPVNGGEEDSVRDGPASQPRRPRHPSVHSLSDDENPAPDPSQVRALARAEVARRKTATNKEPPKKRTPWSLADEEELVEQIRKHGCGWATILEAGNWEFRRDQVALKDKAGNLKASYLKSGVRLPPRFDAVPLKQSQVNAIKQMIPGYEYELGRY